MWKIGHRGACGYAPENSLLSFQKAIDLGLDAVELDVHLSVDNEVMVIHDPTLDRTTPSVGLVNSKTKFELQQLEIPTLAAVLDLIQNRCLVNIELKTKSAAQPTLDLVAKYCESRKASFNQILISSFDWDILSKIAHQWPEYQLGVLYEEEAFDAIALAQTIGAFSLHPNYKLLTFEKVKRIQAFGFKVFPWTVNDPSAIKTLTSWHVDGIISDFPDRI